MTKDRNTLIMKRTLDCKSLLVSVAVVLCVFVINGANGNIASFVSSEGKPNNLTPRSVRGPTVPNYPEDVDGSYIRNIVRQPYPNFGHGYGSGGSRQYYLRNTDHGNSFANANNMMGASSDITQPNNENIPEYDDKPTFIPYIGARALTSVNAYLKHIRDNLEALQSREQDGDYEYEDEDSLEHADHHERNPTRRHISTEQQNGHFENAHLQQRSQDYQHQPLMSDRHMPLNTRRFVNPPTFPDTLIRGPYTSNYNPSWSYTKLGLGKRGRR